MAIRERGSGFQVDIGWKGTRARCNVPDRRTALACEADLLAALKLGKSIDPVIAEYTNRSVRLADAQDGTRGNLRVPRTLADLLDKTYRLIWQDRKSGDHIYQVARRAVEQIGPLKLLAEVSEADVDDLVDFLKENRRSNGTINRQLSALSVMLKLAHERGWIDRLPRIRKMREGQGRLKWYTDDEEAQVLSMCKRLSYDDLGDLIIVLADTGMRVFSEALRLTAGDLLQSPEGRLLAIVRESKNGESRSVPLTDRAKAILVRRASEHPKGSLWPVHTKKRTHTEWARVQTLLEWPSDGTHTLHTWRHTCCSRLVQRGAPLIHVQKWMGHKRIETTMRYAHLAPKDLNQLAGLLDIAADDPPQLGGDLDWKPKSL